jgi:hypothetical protein
LLFFPVVVVVIFFSLRASSSGEHTSCENDTDEESEVFFFVFFFSILFVAVLFPRAALVVALHRLSRMICFLSLCFLLRGERFENFSHLKVPLKKEDRRNMMKKVNVARGVNGREISSPTSSKKTDFSSGRNFRAVFVQTHIRVSMDLFCTIF